MSNAESDSTFRTLSNRGLQCMVKREFVEADRIFQKLLETLDNGPSEDRALTLARIGSCRACLGRPGEAGDYFRAALDVQEGLEKTPAREQQEALLRAELGNALRLTGDYDGARRSYGESLDLFRNLNDLRNVVSLNGRLGSVALFQHDLDVAETCYREARDLARGLKEPAQQALAAHQLGMVFQGAGRLSEAEASYREAAEIRESLHQLTGPGGAAISWNHIGQIAARKGSEAEAETWFRKALDAQRQVDDGGAGQTLHALAALLAEQPGRLPEARECAGEAVSLLTAAGVEEIWETYDLLGDIADRSGLREKAAGYRSLARKARRAFPSTRLELRRHVPLVAAAVAFVHGHDAAGPVIAGEQEAMRAAGAEWSRLADALDRVLAGERDPSVLLGLDAFGGIIVETILEGINDPESLRDLVEEPSGASEPGIG